MDNFTNEINIMKRLLGTEVGDYDDTLLTYYLQCASDIICDMRNTDKVEQKYRTTMVKIAIELWNKQGAEGEIAHSENGISRTYASTDVSPQLLATIIPIAKTPFSTVRSV